MNVLAFISKLLYGSTRPFSGGAFTVLSVADDGGDGRGLSWLKVEGVFVGKDVGTLVGLSDERLVVEALSLV